MSKKNKILLLFPDGVGIRNYLYSDVFKNSSDELILFHNFDDETAREIKENTAINELLWIPKYNETPKEKFLRELICLSRLYYNTFITGNTTLLTNWKSSHVGLAKQVFYKTIEFLVPFFKKYESILKLEKAYQKAIRKNPFYYTIKNLLEEMQPDKIFCSHQRGLQCATVFAAAKDLGIPTTTVIYSWDNLPKARMALRADKYLVWSDYMKQEMKLYYPEIPQSDVLITGTPQFECYENPQNIIPKEIFYTKYDLDLDKKIICYSGDDVLTSPDDVQYLEDIASTIQAHGMDNEYQLLLRRCPVDHSGRFDAVVKKYKGLIKEVPPLWLFKKSSEWNMVYPSREDVSLLVSTAYYSDIVVNVGSTMAFDFSMFGKPCIFINYDQKDKAVKDWSVKTIYEFQHFKSMPDNKAVIWLNDKSEITEKIKASEYDAAAVKHWRNIVVGDYKNASKTIRENLLN